MQELTVDVWEYKKKKIEAAGVIARSNIVICVPTNGVLTPKGTNIMGAGFALAAQNKEPRLAKRFGMTLQEYGNHVMLHYMQNTKEPFEDIYVNFPTKHRWKNNSLLPLIDRSCTELATLAREHPYFEFLLPRPGCGRGNLNWEKDVKPICDTRFINLNNVYIVEKPNGTNN